MFIEMKHPGRPLSVNCDYPPYLATERMGITT
jgi:hypothetical protein